MFARSIRSTPIRWAAIAAALIAPAAQAEPVKLKLAFETSDRASVYRSAIKPFVDAVNSEAKDLVQIEVYFGGALGKPMDVARLMLDGTADLAFVVPGYARGRFPDTSVIELPGLFNNSREATLVYTKLAERKMLKGYDDFVVVGAYGTEPESIHTRQPVTSLADLKDKRLRVNNAIESAVLTKLAAWPVHMPIYKTNEAISTGAIDGAMSPPSGLADYGLARIAPNHYLLRVSAAPLALLMSRKSFDKLPGRAQDIIRKYSGAWAAQQFVSSYGSFTKDIMKELEAIPGHKIVLPSPADRETAKATFKAVVDEWLAENPQHADLLKAAEAELATIRAGQ